MKVTNFGGILPLALGGWSSGVTSINSNATTTDGGLSAINFVQRITANSSNILLNPSVNFAAGSNIILAVSSNTINIASSAGAGTGLFETVISGGGSTVFAHGATGSTETIDPANGNVHTLTIDANCTFTLTGPTSGPMCTIELYLTQGGVGSFLVTWPASVIWPGGTTPTLSTAAGAIDRFVLETHDGGANWFGVQVGGASAGTASPLTTKGDLYTYSTANARLAVGSNGTGLYADSAQTTGNRWTNMPIAGELLISDTPSNPLIFADLIQTDTQDDLVYADL